NTLPLRRDLSVRVRRRRTSRERRWRTTMTISQLNNPRWPTRLQPGALRWARASGHYTATVAFYRDLLGLPVIGEFSGSFGSDGTIFGLPDTGVQLEIIREEAGDGLSVGFDQLVLYLDDDDAVAAATAPLREAGLSP